MFLVQLHWNIKIQPLIVMFGCVKHFINEARVKESLSESGDRSFPGPASWSQSLIYTQRSEEKWGKAEVLDSKLSVWWLGSAQCFHL